MCLGSRFVPNPPVFQPGMFTTMRDVEQMFEDFDQQNPSTTILHMLLMLFRAAARSAFKTRTGFIGGYSPRVGYTPNYGGYPHHWGCTSIMGA